LSDGSAQKIPHAATFGIPPAIRICIRALDFWSNANLAPIFGHRSDGGRGSAILDREKYGNTGTFVTLTAHNPNG
jgi:hypothetical protein